MATHNTDASYSTFNTVGGNQTNYNNTINYYYPQASAHPPPASSDSSPQPPFNDAPIDLLSVHFTGREKEVELISTAFDQIRGEIPRRCALFGDPGVGKSQLTYGWAKFTFEQGLNSYIFWISATTVEKLNQGFSKLLHLVNHPDRSHPDHSVRLTAARRWLEEVDTGNWLMVLDNVFPETLCFLREHLPRKNRRGSLLFTTRTRDVALALASAGGERHEVVVVPNLDVQEAVKLFMRHFDDGEIDVPSVDIQEMVKAVGCLPLAISHAAAYMKQSGCSVKDMLAFYRNNQKFHVGIHARDITFSLMALSAHQLGQRSLRLRASISSSNVQPSAWRS